MSIQDLRALLAPATEKLRIATIELRGAYLEYLNAPELPATIDNNPDLFHEILLDAEGRGFIHYSRLSAAMGLSDPSNASRWFKPVYSEARKTPDKFKRPYAMLALRKIVERDINRMEEGLQPIGGLSIKQYPDLELEIPGKTSTNAAQAPSRPIWNPPPPPQPAFTPDKQKQ